MERCEYCGAEFDGEDALIEHLAAEHRGELGPIDTRRVEAHEGGDGGSLPTGPIVLGVVIVGAIVLAAFVAFGMGGDGGGEVSNPGQDSEVAIPEQGSEAVISQVQTEAASSARHVEPGTTIDYEQLPPTAGPHYPVGSETPAGFYEETQPLGGTVHSLEHGAVVVWYDPAALDDEAREDLQAYASAYQDSFGSFIAVPTPVENPEHPYVLTAWEHRLALDSYDANAVRQFTGEYLGRGPEGSYR